MNCGKCGKYNNPNARFCTGCGAVLMPMNEQPRNEKNNKKPVENMVVVLIFLIVVVVLLLAAIIGGFVYWNNSNSGNKKEREYSNTEVVQEKDRVNKAKADNQEDEPKKSQGDDVKKNKENDIEEPDIMAEEEPDVMEEESSQPKEDKKVEKKETVTTTPKKETSVYTEKMAKKDEFYEKADEIQQYSDTYLSTAMTQADMNIESSIVFEKWDGLLNEVYGYLKSTMPKSEFEKLKKDELNWIAEKEAAIEAAGEEMKGGSAEPMMRYGAGIQYTEERCYYLISLIN